ncbi:MAG: preprotein translocase subunit SecY, partial [Myxococcota bacterium]|nr:preprotein translocase subunit SecY [Myxococcota bacterium]
MANFWNVFQIAELRRKLIFTIMMVGVYRLGIFISVPGVDAEELRRAFQSLSGTLFGLANMFSGGAFEQASIFALGIMPYISASIIIQLCTAAIPTLERLSKEGEAGRRKITQYTRYGTILLSVIQGFGVSNYLAQGIGGMVIVENPDVTFYFITVLTLTAGTTFVMWLGEQITERGVGNGISLIIFASIVAQAPAAARDWYQAVTSGNIEPVPAMILIVAFLAVIATICFFEQAQRRIPIQYARRLTGKSVAAGQTSHLPLKVNVSGVIPPIFASSLLMLPATVSSLVTSDFLEEINNLFSFDSWLYNTVYVALIIFFCYFYTSVTFNPSDVADNLKK